MSVFLFNLKSNNHSNKCYQAKRNRRWRKNFSFGSPSSLFTFVFLLDKWVLFCVTCAHWLLLACWRTTSVDCFRQINKKRNSIQMVNQTEDIKKFPKQLKWQITCQYWNWNWTKPNEREKRLAPKKNDAKQRWIQQQQNRHEIRSLSHLQYFFWPFSFE